MGFWDSLFGKKKKVQEDYTGPKPYESLLQAPGGREYYDELLQRKGGVGVGYRPEILSGTTSAYAKQRRGGLESYEIPAITSGASARGLGRSSVVTSQIGRAEQEAGRDIEERVAQMALEDEKQRRAEINAALSGLGQFASADAANRMGASQFETGLRAQHQAESAARKSQDTDFTNRLISTGATIGGAALGLPFGAPLAGAAIGSSLGSVGGGSTDMDVEDFYNMYDILKARNASQVNMSKPSWFSGLLGGYNG